jgi:hypothetical protein
VPPMASVGSELGRRCCLFSPDLPKRENRALYGETLVYKSTISNIDFHPIVKGQLHCFKIMCSWIIAQFLLCNSTSPIIPMYNLSIKK